ncbi:hypothetical protein A8924_1410 [Saccharopolyspora erythraea NRRL 2338]|uniref:Uncharacterized protein n=2 Tax=Saccharopolyspora erythraea TaxID=1836 RepID=A4F8H4_SACEN|nr:hypothetical protein [Saccharopolyspora erythraea]EQD82339.1 hypothetical protein N599_31215 [Saccharopolyspora erythraea D]PFG94143.1 hypothetical protein A8924_1410 [Saccharopolyspora erythraea NRRL 2338]QRK90932.1 hypothetical protein JQX30_05600 [Saccharopolyspora erythraea]CAM00349.1 hypothetical protein SACE_1017 [Saccharopolyspora erythraea NRRL 2338]
MSYEAATQTLRQAAAKAKSAGDQAAGTDLGSAATDLAAALPGGRSAQAADRVSRSWSETIRAWSRGAGDHGAALDSAAAEYGRNEQAGADAFGRIAADMKEQAG